MIAAGTQRQSWMASEQRAGLTHVRGGLYAFVSIQMIRGHGHIWLKPQACVELVENAGGVAVSRLVAEHRFG